MAEVPTRSGDYACVGCGRVVPGEEAGTIWVRGPLGMSTLRTHPTQECGRAALAARPDLKMYPGNRPPGEDKASV